MNVSNLKRGFGLYVRNMDIAIDEERLFEEFSPFGTVLHAKIIINEATNKRFGIVWFSSLEETSNAITGMNDKMLGDKPLKVALALNSLDGNSYHIPEYMISCGNNRTNISGEIRSRIFTNSALKSTTQTAISSQDPTHITMTRLGPVIPQARTGIQVSPPANIEMINRNRIYGISPNQFQFINGPTSFTGQQLPNLQNLRLVDQSGTRAQPAPVEQAIYIEGHEPLTVRMLVDAIPSDRKQMLGERLCSVIQRVHPEFAGRITELLLENEVAELLLMLEHAELLKMKVDAAMVYFNFLLLDQI